MRRRNDNNEHLRWSLEVEDYRKRLLIAGISTRISYNMIDSYRKVINDLNSYTYDEIKNMMKDEIINIIKGLGLSNARYKYLSSIIDFIEKYDNATWFCHLVLIYYKRYFCNKHNPENCPLRNHVEVKCKCRK
mgnify:FL=1